MPCSKFVKSLARIGGNFGVAFFSPLIGGNVADTVFNVEFTLNQILVVSLLAALFTSGLAVSREAVDYGKSK